MANGEIQSVRIEQEMRDAYLDYAMSVIVARALPDARDGLKPVHRRILYAMFDMGMRADSAYKKSARIVGEVLGKYHPHGDAAVYDSMVRLAQNFSMRYMLVDGQGNFGSIDGDSAAAMRYTEARMAPIGQELLADIERDTVNFVENFDGSLTEPGVLPASLPNLLVNGASGIAVGMSTNIPPHNLGEVCDALVYMLSHWSRLEDITIDELMQFIKGPDFPTGGVIYTHQDNEDDSNPVAQAYATGRGKITVRAKVHIEDMGRGKSRIIISELPYQVSKTTLIERIADLVNQGRLEGLSDLRDESDRNNAVRLVVELQRGAEPTDVLANLFKLTPLQETFSIILLALVDKQPRMLTLKQALRVYLDHRFEIVRRRSEFDLARATERAHILEGLLKALNNMEEVVRIIRSSRNSDTARENLMQALAITEVQAQAILDMPLRRLAALETQKIQDEYQEKLALIAYLQGLLADAGKIRLVIAEELATIRLKYADLRRTVIASSTAAVVSASDFLVPEEATWLTLTIDNRLGRSLTPAAPKITASSKTPPRLLIESSTAQTLYLFTARGESATIPVQQLPKINDFSEGTPFKDLCPLPASEEIVAGLALPTSITEGYLFFVTAGGEVKRLRLEDLPGVSARAFSVMNVEAEDKLLTVMVTGGQDEVLLVTAGGQAIRFAEDDVRPTGLSAGGMRGIKLLGQRDRVTGALLIQPGQLIINITEDGVAKASPVEEYPAQGRAGSGVISMRLPADSREVVAAAAGRPDETLVILTGKGKAQALKFGKFPLLKRGKAGGDFVVSPGAKDSVARLVTYQPRRLPPADSNGRGS
ncbi:MAG: DNA topoisomerase (ATP-hydrolyzing) subunit A [Anaerolineae bacterium]|nr:DNA topoisomerase (ATP-hydrolyzing) subunit A [Anaerolineae bacterium]